MEEQNNDQLAQEPSKEDNRSITFRANLAKARATKLELMKQQKKEIEEKARQEALACKQKNNSNNKS